jgi:hypothetical protein
MTLLASLSEALDKAIQAKQVVGKYSLDNPALTQVLIKQNFLSTRHEALDREVDQQITRRPHVDMKRYQGAGYVDRGEQVVKGHNIRTSNLRIGLANNDWRLVGIWKTEGLVPADPRFPRGAKINKVTVVQDWRRRDAVDDGHRPELLPGMDAAKHAERIAELEAMPKVADLDQKTLDLVRELNGHRKWKDCFVWWNPPGKYPGTNPHKLEDQADGILTINLRGPSWDHEAENAATSLVVHDHQLMVIDNLLPGGEEE